MPQPITRRTVNIPSFGASNILATSAINTITGSLDNLGQAVNNFGQIANNEDRRQQEANLLQSRISASEQQTANAATQGLIAQGNLANQSQVQGRQADAAAQNLLNSQLTGQLRQGQLDDAADARTQAGNIQSGTSDILGRIGSFNNAQEITNEVAAIGRRDGLTPTEINTITNQATQQFNQLTALSPQQQLQFNQAQQQERDNIAAFTQGGQQRINQLAAETGVNPQLLNLQQDESLDFEETRARYSRLNETATNQIIRAFSSRFGEIPKGAALEYIASQLARESNLPFDSDLELDEDDSRLDGIIDDFYRSSQGEEAQAVRNLRNQLANVVSNRESELASNSLSLRDSITRSNLGVATGQDTVVNPNFNLVNTDNTSTQGFSNLLTTALRRASGNQ